MACKLLSSGNGVPFLWNISNKVGDTSVCVNSPTDVELVNFFLEFIASRMVGSGKIQNRGITINGTFDVATGYWIYYLQTIRNEKVYPGSKVDGIISPAARFDAKTWTIAYFNGVLFNQDKNLFSSLDQSPKLSSALRAELSKVKR